MSDDEGWGDEWEEDPVESPPPRAKGKASAAAAAAASPSAKGGSSSSSSSMAAPHDMGWDRRYNVLELDALVSRQATVVEEIREMLGVSADEAGIMLREYRYSIDRSLLVKLV
jgi:hypothetical protein